MELYLHTTYILIVWFIIKDKEHFFASISSCSVIEKLVFAGPPFQISKVHDCSQEPVTGPYPKPVQSTASYHMSLGVTLILPSHLCLGLPCEFLLQFSTLKFLILYLQVPCSSLLALLHLSAPIIVYCIG